MRIPWCRHGWRGTIAANAELFRQRAYCAEIGATEASATYRLVCV
jgi:hypothetical protein